MEEIKMEVRSKQLDGSTEVSKVTLNENNELESENSVEPSPTPSGTKINLFKIEFKQSYYHFYIKFLSTKDTITYNDIKEGLQKIISGYEFYAEAGYIGTFIEAEINNQNQLGLCFYSGNDSAEWIWVEENDIDSIIKIEL